MNDPVSLDQFYQCIKDYMGRFRDTTDIEAIQKAHVDAVKKCSKT